MVYLSPYGPCIAGCGEARADVTVAGVLLASATGWWTVSLISLCTLPLREL